MAEGGRSASGVLTTPGNTAATQALVAVQGGRLSIVVGDGAQSWLLTDVCLERQPGSRLMISVDGARLHFRPDRPSDCGLLVGLARRHGGARLPSLGLEGGAAPTERGLPSPDADSGESRRSHTCRWEVRNTAYGIVRRICVVCRAVSIDLTDGDPGRIRHIEPGG